MKVILVNGSPHEHGTTAAALSKVKEALEENAVQTEIFWIGNQPIGGCIACKACYQTAKCAFGGKVNEFAELAKDADGFVFGSPVHYASASGNLTAFLDRVFYSAPKDYFRLKPCAVVTAARRGGTTAAYEQLLKYPGISEMPIISSRYWNMVHGSCAEDAEKDEEGMTCMRVLGINMAYFLKCQEAAKNAGIELPNPEPVAKTNFIR